MTRRTLLGGLGAGVMATATAGLVEYELLPGRTPAYRTLGLNGDAGTVPDVEPGPVVTGTIASPYVGKPAGWVLCYPPGARPGDRLPVVVGLHGAGGDAEGTLRSHALDRYLAAGRGGFVIALVDGGEAYWHRRADVTDPGLMVLDDFLPMLGRRGLDVAAPGFIGWSMGGYGAMLLAARRREQGGAVGPVVAVSPAVWEEYDDATDRAFDDEAQFAEFAPFGLPDRLAGVEVRLDCGRGDPFYRTVRAFTDGRPFEVHLDAGGHDEAYWTRMLPDELAWLGARL